MPVNLTEELFAKIAVATFGDKIRLMHWADLPLPDEGLTYENEVGEVFTVSIKEVRDAIRDWPDCYYAVGNKCPWCGEELSLDSFFSTFKWGLAYGRGFCANRIWGKDGDEQCGQRFQYYHTFKANGMIWHLDFFEIISLPREAIEKYLEEHPEENETAIS